MIDCEKSLFLSKTVGKNANRAGVVRRAKGETALVTCNDLDAWHSGDGVVILLVGLRSYDAHLSVSFRSDMQ